MDTYQSRANRTKLTGLPPRFEPGFLRNMDRRLALSQRLSAVYETIVDDLGGQDTLSHTKLALVERFVFLEAVLQTWEEKIATDPKEAEPLMGKWIQAVNSLQGLARYIGLDRAERPMVNLRAYVEAKQ